MIKVVGQNKGFKIEKKIIDYVNKKLFNEINLNYKVLIKKMFDLSHSRNPIVRCFKEEGIGLQKKTDLIFELENQRLNISVKSGSANSVHQEKFNSFLEFLDSVSQLKISEKNLIKEFHWCDGSTDNTGLVKDRKRKNIYANLHPTNFTKYITILRRYKKDIFLRTWLGGSKNTPDYLIYITNINEIHSPKVINFSDLLDAHMNYKEKRGDIGLLKIQNWNACLQGQDLKPKSLKHRNDVQFKAKDIKNFFL